MNVVYQDDLVTLVHGDCRDTPWPQEEVGLLVLDPPWDHPELLDLGWQVPPALVFTDPRRLGSVVERFGGPAWVFTWDTMSPWQTGPGRPLQQCKQALWFGELESYQRDATAIGPAAPPKDHPSTRTRSSDGRRLTDLYRESLRWLHNPTTGKGSAGTERFSQRQGPPALRHAKPLRWVQAMVGNTSTGLIFDPFAGTGTTLVAAQRLGRRAFGIEKDEQACEWAAMRLAGENPDADPSQVTMNL